MHLGRILKWTFSASLVLAAAAIGVWHFWLRRPVGEGPVDIPVRRGEFDAPWTQRPVRLVAMGDSITAGFGAAPGRSYVERLMRNPPDDFADVRGLCLEAVLPDFGWTNLAISGSTSLQHEKVQLPRLKQHGTNVLGIVTITTGGNDLIHDYGRTPPVEGAMFGATWEEAQPWIRGFEDRLHRILARTRRAFPGGCHIFLANIYDPSDGTGSLRWVFLPGWPDGMRIHAAYNRILERVAERDNDVHPVDIHRPFLGHGLYCAQFWRRHFRSEDPHHWYLSNIEDPNDRGYDALRRLFLNAMVEALHPGSDARAPR